MIVSSYVNEYVNATTILDYKNKGKTSKREMKQTLKTVIFLDLINDTLL